MTIHFNPPSVYFMHIPKTGCSSTGNYLRSIYRARDYIDLNVPEIFALAPGRLATFRCYHSVHHGFNMLKFTNRSDLTTFTILREPIERSVSKFEHHRRQVLQHPEQFSAQIKSRANKDIADIEYQQLANVVST
ncbi:MAG: sulfotransferase family 2 domain-containing protein [Chloroflexi bacterium]|nr:sulfotransferase family 2 domain-containing protein [Chloroflexota bacterium]